ncbi:beta strand repeat-containing protein [Roseateles saccharophilus]|nr:hypothetical protein [Roseateles saccharophilus]MDG0833206.1 hypothetical protein [Roseateles saccharophilus]
MRLARGVFAALGLVMFGALAAPPDGQQAPNPNFVANPHPFGLAGKPHVLPMRAPGYFAAPRSAPAGAHLTYYGGRVVSNMQVVQVLWGTGSYLAQVQNTTTPSMASFYQQALNSTYVDWLSEYNTSGLAAPTSNQVIGRGSFLGQYIITPSVTSATVDDTQIQAELSSQIAAGHLPAPTTDAAGNANTYYAVYFPAGKTITQGGSSSCVSGGFCAYHGTVASATAELLYGVHPDMQPGSGCSTGCGSALTTFANQTSVASHEMVETITDAEVGLATVVGLPLAWYDTTNGEIGDICNAQQGSFLGNDGFTYTVQLEFSNLQNNCVVSSTTATDFSISASPASVSIVAGGSTTSTISTKVTAGTAGTVNLTVSGAPAGVTASLSPTSVGAGNSAILTLSSTAAAAAGTYSIVVNGIEGSASHSTTVSLTITGASQDFSLSASPASASVASGGSTSSTISTAVTTGSAGTVALGVSGVPSGATASLSPTSVTAGGSSTLSVNTGTAAAGSYTLTVTGVEGSKTHSTSFALTITSLPDFSIAASPASATVAAGGSASSSISTAVTAGSAATVSLSVSGLPGGATAGLSPPSVTAGGSSTLTVNAGTAAPGSYTLTVTGVEGTKTHSTAFVLTIASPPDFSIAASPSSLALAAGGSGSSTISTAVTAGSAATVALAISGLPSGATGSLSPASVTAGSSSTLTVNAGTAAPGSYTVSVTGTEGAASHSTSVTVTIGGIVNGGFETGTLSGWTPSGAANTVVSAGCNTGSYCAQIGATTPSNGNSSLAQTFVVPSGKTSLSLFYKVSCPAVASRYDGVTITLADLTRGRTSTLLSRTCTNTGAFAAVTGRVTAGHNYTLTVTTVDSHKAQLDLVYTLLDDVALLP